jgi:hypothetical protein
MAPSLAPALLLTRSAPVYLSEQVMPGARDLEMSDAKPPEDAALPLILRDNKSSHQG